MKGGHFSSSGSRRRLDKKYLIIPGIKATLIRRRQNMQDNLQHKIDTIVAQDIDRIKVNEAVKTLEGRVKDTKVYVSMDFNVSLFPFVYLCLCLGIKEN